MNIPEELICKAAGRQGPTVAVSHAQPPEEERRRLLARLQALAGACGGEEEFAEADGPREARDLPAHTLTNAR